MKDTKLYMINDITFAVIFIIARVFLTPLFMVYMYEGENILYSIKLGVSFILFVQLFWAYRIIQLVFETLIEPYKKKEKKPPAFYVMGHNLMTKI